MSWAEDKARELADPDGDALWKNRDVTMAIERAIRDTIKKCAEVAKPPRGFIEVPGSMTTARAARDVLFGAIDRIHKLGTS